MNWEQFFSLDTLTSLGIPVGIGLLVALAVYLLRRVVYKYVQKLTAKTKTEFDDILIHETSVATLLWCFWLGIYVGFKVYAAPDSWIDITAKLIPALFAALGAYTIIMLLVSSFKWYKKDVCFVTASSLDDMIMGTLIFGTPIIGTILTAVWILNILGVEVKAVNDWLGLHLLNLFILGVVVVTALLLSVLVLPKIIIRAVHDTRAEQSEEEMKKRSDTLIGVSVATVQIILIFMFVLMVLTELTINVTAVLTGAGVVGLAVGFGAQSLVKDIIAGLFIIMENQYRKGDVVTIAGVSGVVEEINLRRTILRDMDGTYHVIPNGEIRVSSNSTKQLSRVNLVISVDYETDLEKAMQVINRVGLEMSEDPVWMSFIVTPPKALRVDNLGESGIDIRVTGEVKPSRQWEVAGELRLRLKKAFKKEGIDIPYPHTKVIFGNKPPV